MKIELSPAMRQAGHQLTGINKQIEQVRVLFRGRNYAAAEPVLRQLIDQEPHRPNHQRGLALALLMQNKHQQALEVIDRALGLPTNSLQRVFSTILKVRILMSLGADRETCARLLVEAIKADHFSPAAITAVRTTLDNLNVPTEALQALDLTIKYRSDFTLQQFDLVFSQQLNDGLNQSDFLPSGQQQIKRAVEAAFRAVDRPSIKGKYIHRAAAYIRQLDPKQLKLAIQSQETDPAMLERIYQVLVLQRHPRHRLPHVDWPHIEPTVKLLEIVLEKPAALV